MQEDVDTLGNAMNAMAGQGHGQELYVSKLQALYSLYISSSLLRIVLPPIATQELPLDSSASDPTPVHSQSLGRFA